MASLHLATLSSQDNRDGTREQAQSIPKSLRAGEKGRFDDQNNIALLPPQGRMKLRISPE